MKLSSSARIQTALETIGITSYETILLHVPRTYEDLSLTQDILKIDRQRLVLSGKIVTQPKVFRHARFSSTTFKFMAHDQHLYSVIAFNRPFFAKSIQLNTLYRLIATYDAKRSSLNLLQVLKDDGNLPLLKPVYALPDDVPQYVFTRLVDKALRDIEKLTIPSHVPPDFLLHHHALPIKEAIKILHRPPSFQAVEEASRLFKFEEAFEYFRYMHALKANQQSLHKQHVNTIPYGQVIDRLEHLPYTFTTDQFQTLDEILHDMNNAIVMHRLLQGDVGSGKTVVAAMACYANFLRGQQSVFMAPTDTLAKQHFATFKRLLENDGIHIALIVGSLSFKEKNQIKQQLLDGSIDLCIGTHAVFSDDVTYHDLGLVVIDEQHRFGIQQREKLRQKGPHADFLMMSATPIPRSLAMTLYANMDVSTLTQFPYAKRQVDTMIIQADNALLDYSIQLALEQQKCIYVIAPAIEESTMGKQTVDTLFQTYHQRYPGKVVRLHGQMDETTKTEALQAFERATKPILVSTTVVEVGIDVPQASLMLIHDANTFGLATLHQLRGRIGRDGSTATCFLIVQDEGLLDHERLQVLVETQDGFLISQHDLSLRGPGEVLGVKQAGMPSFHVLNLVKDHAILHAVKQFLSSHIRE